MAFGCVRAIINTESALIFDAHKPTIKQQSLRISKQLMRKDSFAFRDGEIIFHGGKEGSSSSSKSTQFEIDMVESIVREVCTMYSRRIRLYEPIVNSLMDRVTNEAFSPSGLHKLVPVKDSLQHFGKYQQRPLEISSRLDLFLQSGTFKYIFNLLIIASTSRNECEGGSSVHHRATIQ